MDKATAHLLSQFVAEVRLTDPSYQQPMSDEMFFQYLMSGLPVDVNSDGIAMAEVLVPEWMEWGFVPYVEQNVCCCMHSAHECRFEQKIPFGGDVRFEKVEHGCTMCVDCVHSWEDDWEVIRPTLV